MEELFRAHYPLVFTYLLRRTHDRALSEDLAQETFLRATRAFLGWRGGRPQAWLLTIAANALIDHARKRRLTLPLLEELVPSVQPEGSTFPREIIDILVDLPQPQGRLLALAYGYGFTHAEIAEMLGTSTGAVKTALWRARESFRTAYEEAQ
ncbi:MAG TPA: RNA polymerase sigma factor [Actinomycetota bacterium]|nr:RNA polymerase sigma factor [Actinomycetota bacterium]